MTLVYIAALIFGLGGLYAILNGPPYVPIDEKALKKTMEFLEVRSGEKYADLGSGDGRTLIAIAEAGGEAHGYEFNPLLVAWSRRKIRKAGLSHLVFVHSKNFWRVNVSHFSGIVVFGANHIMERLEKKLTTELRPGSRIASHVFKFPNLKPKGHEDGVYFYEV
jgi:cyclopropane fatty-acyl-phospholipid synthase-like methyltransferase